ncbi:MAG: hypothetical protein ABL962_07750 [Fimbriimonadaceae bacterium]
MCALVDACVKSRVFNSKDAEHPKFETISKWIVEGSGNVVYGGKTYMEQLGSRYRDLFLELKTAGRAHRIPSDKVDQLEELLKKKVNNKKFDDAHLIALIRLSKCCIICTSDDRFLPFFRRKDLYPRGAKQPKIHSLNQGSKHCSNSEVVGECPRRISADASGRRPKARPKVPLLSR